MKVLRNNSLVYKEVPDGLPIPGKTLKLEEGSLDIDDDLKLLPGSILVKTKWLSLDPYLRGLMRDPSIPSYSEPFELNKPMVSSGVAEVVLSRHPKLQPGDHINGLMNFSEYCYISEDKIPRYKKVEKSGSLSWSTFLGAVGGVGRTAWYGVTKIAKPQKGETIYISGAAGAVGILVAQLCKRAGCRLLGSAGSDEKVAYLKNELGFDAAWNYKTTSTVEMLRSHPYEIYWDNVQGPQLDAVLLTIKNNGRIVCCGGISSYNNETYSIKHIDQFLKKSLYMQAFVLGTMDPAIMEPFYDEFAPLVAEGEIKLPEKIWKGLDNGEAFVGMLQGDNLGKSLICLE